MIEPCPCNGCHERFLACSARCPIDARGGYGYEAWRAQYQAQKKHLADNKYRFCIPTSAARDKFNNYHLKHPTKGQKGGDQ